MPDLSGVTFPGLLSGVETVVVMVEGETATLAILAGVGDGLLVHVDALPAHLHVAHLICALLRVSINL